VSNAYHDGLQIYGQGAWHGDASIAGTREALTALRDAINSVLETGKEEKALFFSSDGEGYEVRVIPASVEELERMPCWYVEDHANPSRFEERLALQRRVWELQAALKKVRVHNRGENK
jgi:hypothetical protein